MRGMTPFVFGLVMTPLFTALLVLAAPNFLPRKRPEPRKTEAWQDVEVTYAQARAALPDSIREDFHPDWPWLDVNDAPRTKPRKSPDAHLFEVWDLSQGRPL
jgi:hypothetical protein